MNLPWRLFAALASILLAPAAVHAGDPRDRALEAVRSAAAEVFPARDNGSAPWLAEHFDANLIVSDATTLSVVLIQPGAWSQRALGYFTYELDWLGRVHILGARRIGRTESAPAPGASFALEDARGEPRLFHRGERVGFYVEPAGGKPLERSAARDPKDRKSFGPSTFTTLAAFNPEARSAGTALARHAGAVWMPALEDFAGNAAFLLLGFEDSVRAPGPEQDFDDLVFAVVPGSSAALSETHAFVVAPSDLDRDGLDTAYDAYPSDAQRAFVERAPRDHRATLALEEDYPEVGDLDYNDALVHFDWWVVSDARGNVKDVLATFDLVGRFSRFDHSLALRLSPLPEGVAGSVQVERHGGVVQRDDLESRSIEECLLAFDGRLPDPIPSTRGMRPFLMTTRTAAASGGPAAPIPASARVWISFDTCVDPTWLEPLPFEPFFVVRKGELECDVHLAGSRPLSVRSSQLPREEGPQSFVSRQGYPYLLYLPTEWRAPAEGVAAWDLYPGFRAWVATRGARNTDWFLHPSPRAERETQGPREGLPQRAWRLQLPPAR